MAEYADRERFIPYPTREIVDMLCADGELSDEEQGAFRAFCAMLQSLYHFEFHAKVQALKEYYHPFNPDRDTQTTRRYSAKNLQKCETGLIAKFQEILNDANYEELTEQELQHALEEESLFPISLDIDFEDFARYIIYRRGTVTHTAKVRKLFREIGIQVPTFERVVLLVKFKDAAYFAEKGNRPLAFEPGSMLIKLFKNIPKADLEMLFPNAQVKMRPRDKLIMGVPAIGGAIGVVMKTSAGLIAFTFVLMTLIAQMVKGGQIKMPGPQEMAQIIGGFTALGMIGGFVFQQWVKYKNRKIEFMKTLGDSLYFKNLDNNVGVFHHIIDAAEEEECKEAILGYYFLLAHPQGLTEADLDDAIETWFATRHDTLLDFEVDDALRKLRGLGLCRTGEEERPIYQAIALKDACAHVDYIWDNYFQYNV